MNATTSGRQARRPQLEQDSVFARVLVVVLGSLAAAGGLHLLLRLGAGA